ncbi:MAG: recombinase family protein [Rhodopila sp.]
MRAAQQPELKNSEPKRVFRETARGARTDRAPPRKALDQLHAGDVLMVTRLDRLDRSTGRGGRRWFQSVLN